jgi:Spy/CpxP family protein refolding chaperone
MRRIGAWLVVAGLVGTMASMGAWAQAPEGNPAGQRPRGPRNGQQTMRMQPGAGWMQEMAVARILNDAKAIADVGLSDDQVKALKDSADQLKTKRDDLQKQLTELETQQNKLMEEATVDEKAVLADLEKISQLRLELDKLRFQHLILIKKTLTPEQSAKIKETIAQHMRGPAGIRKGETPKEADKPATP